MNAGFVDIQDCVIMKQAWENNLKDFTQEDCIITISEKRLYGVIHTFLII